MFLMIHSHTAVSDANQSADPVFDYLNEVMDKYHRTFDVYTDLSEAGNHFVALGRMTSAGGENYVAIDPGFRSGCFSGVTCIENRFYSSGDNWGGWYFMNGVLEGEEVQPKLNWGDYPNAGLDLTGATKLTFYAKGKAGGERVEFFAFGVGRDAISGEPLSPYPDSSPKISLNYITLTTSWTKYTIDVKSADLSYVLGGLGWVTGAGQNNGQDVIFYLDEIRYDKPRLEEPRFLVSYETTASTADFDKVMKNVAFGYDNALALNAYLSRGTPDDMRRANLIADAFVYALNNDRFFNDGRLRNGYQGGDLILWPGWRPHGKVGTVRMPGWWDAANYTWYEDEFAVSTHTGNVVWPMIALLNYYKKAGGSLYLQTALTLGEWVERETKDERCDGGYTGGFEGWEKTAKNPSEQEKLIYKATEHNIDIYPVFMMLHNIAGDAKWRDRAFHAKAFVETMWNEQDGHFWTGTLNDGCEKNKSNIPLDIQPWALLALGEYNTALKWAVGNCYTEHHGFRGFDFNNDRDGVWFEGTAQMAVAFQRNRERIQAQKCIGELRKALRPGIGNVGKGLPAACHDGVSTGFDWEYFNRLHVGATAWYLLAEMKFNPFSGMRIVPVPGVGYLFLLL
jgi:hypothetical protein